MLSSPVSSVATPTSKQAMSEIMWSRNTSQTCLCITVDFVMPLLEPRHSLITILQDYIGNKITDLIDFVFSGPEEVLQTHVKKDENTNIYYCNICRQFSNRGSANVRNHVEAKHFPNMFTYSCELCDMTFGKKTALYNHRKNIHKKSVF